MSTEAAATRRTKLKLLFRPCITALSITTTYTFPDPRRSLKKKPDQNLSHNTSLSTSPTS